MGNTHIHNIKPLKTLLFPAIGQGRCHVLARILYPTRTVDSPHYRRQTRLVRRAFAHASLQWRSVRLQSQNANIRANE